MKETFEVRNFRKAAMSEIEFVNLVLIEYEQDGFVLTLRQLYYQLVARGQRPNDERSYKNLSALVSSARDAGLIDWDMIEDRGREMVRPTAWRSPAHIVGVAAESYRVDRWAGQAHYCEVMVEKQALEGVLLPVCDKLDVPLTANKGYSSASCMYAAGKRIAERLQEGRRIHVLYLGDHDPSGLDMTRDVEERLGKYSGVDVDVVRLALNRQQIDELKPMPNPAKLTDSRAPAYIEQHGESSWELDAIEPRQLAALVTNEVLKWRDDSLWKAALQREAEDREVLLQLADAFRR
jgi:hypothetical protein